MIRVIRLWRALGFTFAFLAVLGAFMYLSSPGEPDADVMAGSRGATVTAQITGHPQLAPDLKGTVRLVPYRDGTLVVVRVTGLPPYKSGNPPIGPFGFHVHERGDCTPGSPDDPFAGAGGHYNPDNQPHGNHAGDLPVLFSNGGRAYMAVYTDRFKPFDVVGRSIMIHENPDDYRSQPAGASGRRIGCGVFRRSKR